MKPVLAKLPVYEVTCGNQEIAKVVGDAFEAVAGEQKLSAGEKAGVRRIIARGFDGMTVIAGSGRQLSISRKG